MEKQYINLGVSALIAFGGLTTVLILARFGSYSDVMMVIFFAGSVGAVVNNYFRLSTLSSSPNNIKSDLNQSAVTIQMYVSLFISGILGIVAYGLFLSGILQGELFPEFDKIKQDYTSLTNLLIDVTPKSNLDTAKAIIWAFIAGFSERFIPNALDSLISRSNDGGQ